MYAKIRETIAKTQDKPNYNLLKHNMQCFGLTFIIQNGKIYVTIQTYLGFTS